MKSPINLIKGDKIGSETDYRDALPVNMFGVLKPVLGAAGYMIQYQGITSFASTNGADRGGIYNERFGDHYRVAAGRFISINESGVVTDLGGLPNDTKNVSLPYSFNTQGILSFNRFFLYSPSGGLSEVTDPDLGDPIDVVWIDGYYFFTDGDFLFHTEINDETSIDPLAFATAEFMPDKSLGLGKTQDNKVIVFGRYTTEYFVNVASDPFAFQRVQTRAIKIGIVGTYCKAEAAGKWYILGGRKEEAVSVHVLGVGSAQKVATREVDKIIGKYTESELANAYVEAYEEDGYSFVLITLPNDTLLFNETLASSAGIDQAWTILRSDTLGNDPYRGWHYVFDARIGHWLMGDRNTNDIGLLDNTTATQYDAIAEWLLFTPFVYLDSQSIDEFEVETMPGHTGSDDATVFLSLTYDGVTYGKEWTELYGQPNDYGKRFIVRRLGYIRDWFGMKLRGATRSRMAFGRGFISHG